MKNKILYILSALLFIMAGCSDEKLSGVDGIGTLVITTSMSDNILNTDNMSRSIDDSETLEELLSKLHIIISKSNGDAIRYWRSYSEMVNSGVADPSGSKLSVNLNTGLYIIEAWTGDSVPASFEHRFFKGQVSATVEPYASTDAEIKCSIANVAAAVEYAPEISYYLSDITFVVGHSGGELKFVGEDDRRGYFMMPYGDNYLEWELSGKLRSGETYSKSGRTRVLRSYLYTYKFSFDPEIDERGAAASIVLNVKETPLETINEPVISFRTKPGVFKINEGREYPVSEERSVSGATGYIGELDFMARSSGKLTDLRLSFDAIESSDIPERIIPLFENGLTIMGNGIVNDNTESNELITYDVECTIDESKQTSRIGFSLTSELTNNLNKGIYVLTVDLTDEDMRAPNDYSTEASIKSNRESFMITVSDDGTLAVEPLSEDLSLRTPSSVVIRGKIMTDDVVQAGFRYRLSGTVEWSDIVESVSSGPFVKGSEFTTSISGLHEGWTYEYITVFKKNDDIEWTNGSVAEQVTTIAPQLPNSSFEEWQGSSPLLIYNERATSEFYPGAETVGDNRSMFWDSGNTGSATLNKNVTTYSTDYAVDGKYSVKLESQFVGVGSSLGKFAAGNMFIGAYLKTNGMTGGELGWGRKFTYRPKALKVWVKYIQGTVDRYQSNPYVNNGDPDQGVIYLALMTDDLTTHGDGTYPIHLDTRYTNTFFDKTWDNVIASGERVFTESTPGSGMIQITIPLDYKEGREDEIPSYIMMTCSASRAGDYFCGSTKSVMYLDYMELVY